MDAVIIQRTQATLHAFGLHEDAKAVRALEQAMRDIHALADTATGAPAPTIAAAVERIRNLAAKALS
jgi:hypothetical protein